VEGCKNLADWKGWYRVIGPFNIPTGVMQWKQVCEKHKLCLIGFQKELKQKIAKEKENEQRTI